MINPLRGESNEPNTMRLETFSDAAIAMQIESRADRSQYLLISRFFRLEWRSPEPECAWLVVLSSTDSAGIRPGICDEGDADCGPAKRKNCARLPRTGKSIRRHGAGAIRCVGGGTQGLRSGRRDSRLSSFSPLLPWSGRRVGRHHQCPAGYPDGEYCRS